MAPPGDELKPFSRVILVTVALAPPSTVRGGWKWSPSSVAGPLSFSFLPEMMKAPTHVPSTTIFEPDGAALMAFWRLSAGQWTRMADADATPVPTNDRAAAP